MVRLLILPSEENDPGKPPTRVGFSAKTSIHKWFLMTFSKNPVFLRKVACQGGAHPASTKATSGGCLSTSADTNVTAVAIRSPTP